MRKGVDEGLGARRLNLAVIYIPIYRCHLKLSTRLLLVVTEMYLLPWRRAPPYPIVAEFSWFCWVIVVGSGWSTIYVMLSAVCV